MGTRLSEYQVALLIDGVVRIGRGGRVVVCKDLSGFFEGDTVFARVRNSLLVIPLELHARASRPAFDGIFEASNVVERAGNARIWRLEREIRAAVLGGLKAANRKAS